MSTVAAAQQALTKITPSYLHGVIDKTRAEQPLIFRDLLFNRPDILTDRDEVVWHEISNTDPNFVPPVVNPCDDFTYIQTNKGWKKKSATMPYVQLGSDVNCEFRQTLEAGECYDTATSYGQAVQNEYNRRAALVDKSFRYLENYWSACAAFNQEVRIEGPNIEPYMLEYKRKACLDKCLEGQDMWGKDGTTNPIRTLEYMNDMQFEVTGGQTNRVMMTQATWNLFKESPAIQDAKNCENLGLVYPTIQNQGLFNQEMQSPFRGAKRVAIMQLDGADMEIWVVKAYFKFINPMTGQLVEINLIKNGMVHGFDIGTGDNQYGAGYVYGGIQNMHAGENRKRNFFARGYLPENGKSMKYEAESSPLPLIFCPDASWSMKVGPESLDMLGACADE